MSELDFWKFKVAATWKTVEAKKSIGGHEGSKLDLLELNGNGSMEVNYAQLSNW